jgi:hypothetical protein
LRSAAAADRRCVEACERRGEADPPIDRDPAFDEQREVIS